MSPPPGPSIVQAGAQEVILSEAERSGEGSSRKLLEGEGGACTLRWAFLLERWRRGMGGGVAYDIPLTAAHVF